MSKYVNKPSYCKKKNDLSVLYLLPMKLWILGMHEQFSKPLDKCNSQGFLQVKLLYHRLSTHQYNSLNHLQLENTDLVIEQKSINPQHNSPPTTYNQTTIITETVITVTSSHFKQLNKKKKSFWCSDSAFAQHLYSHQQMNQNRMLFSKTPKHTMAICERNSHLHCFCLPLSEINTFFNLQDSMIILLLLLVVNWSLKIRHNTFRIPKSVVIILKLLIGNLLSFILSKRQKYRTKYLEYKQMREGI